jgi:hypothetical protein
VAAFTIDYSGGDWINNGTISSTEGTLISGPVAYAGSGTTNIKDLKVAHVERVCYRVKLR